MQSQSLTSHSFIHKVYKERVWAATSTDHNINLIVASILRQSICSSMLCSHSCRTFLLWVRNKSEKTQTPFSVKFQWADAHSLHKKFPPSKSLQRNTRLVPVPYGISVKAMQVLFIQTWQTAQFSNAIWFLIMPLTQFEDFEYRNISYFRQTANI